MARDLNKLSRVMSHALRHEPWLYELELDDEGWTDVEALLVALRAESPSWSTLGERDLLDVIGSSPKQRHEMAAGRIRAIYGHSLPGKLHRTPAEPPTMLFHGTSREAAAQILKAGLMPMGRQYVHLSVEQAMADAVGGRKTGSPVILTVRAHDAWAAGVAFYAGNDKVWLADHVPPAFVAGQP
ncbi:MAG: RNA 2'-phosphotransferase [Reyranella sp.]|nr:RNA 2'-phosphotransferase [Reyranella sp.]